MREALPWLRNACLQPPGPSHCDGAALNCGGEKVLGQGDCSLVMLQSGYELPLLCRNQGLDFGLSNTSKFISN